MPFVLATISEITIRISASDRLVRIPAKICGDAAGRITRSSRSRRGMPYESRGLAQRRVDARDAVDRC